MAGKQYGAKLPPDLAEPIEDYHQADEDTSQADAIRHYIREGIEHKQQQPQPSNKPGVNPADFLMDTARVTLAGSIILGVGGVSSGTLGVSNAITGAGILATISLTIILVASSSTLTLGLPRKTREVNDEH